MPIFIAAPAHGGPEDLRAPSAHLAPDGIFFVLWSI